VSEQLFSRPHEGNKVYRPFAHTAQVRCRGYSLGLERVVTDLAADCSFAQAVEKVSEHYGIGVSPSTVRVITEGHGLAMSEESSRAVRMPASGVSAAFRRDGWLASSVCGDWRGYGRSKKTAHFLLA